MYDGYVPDKIISSIPTKWEAEASPKNFCKAQGVSILYRHYYVMHVAPLAYVEECNGLWAIVYLFPRVFPHHEKIRDLAEAKECVENYFNGISQP